MGLNRRHENTMDVRARDWVALRGAGGHVAVPVGALRGGWAWAGAEPGRLRRQTIKYNATGPHLSTNTFTEHRIF